MTDLPLIRSTRSAVKWTIFFSVLLILSFTPFSLWVLLALYMLGTCALAVATLNGGLVPGLAGLVLSSASMHVLLGPQGAWCTAAYLGLTYVLFLILYVKKVPFWYTAAALVLAQLVSQLGIYLVLGSMVEGDLFIAAGHAVSTLVRESELCDVLLSTLYQSGLITLSPEYLDSAVVESLTGFVLSDVARDELLLSLADTLRSMLSAMLPGMLISHSIETGVLTCAWPLLSAQRKHQQLLVQDLPEKRNPPVHTLDMPPFRDWHIPRPWGLRIAILGAGYFLALSQNSALSLLGQMFFSLFSAVYGIQGMATLNFIQHKKGTRRGWRIALPIILTLLLPNALLFLGIIDQVTNLRALRPMPEMPEGFPFPGREDEETNDDDDDDDNQLI